MQAVVPVLANIGRLRDYDAVVARVRFGGLAFVEGWRYGGFAVV
jgi:hypothetical protein